AVYPLVPRYSGERNLPYTAGFTLRIARLGGSRRGSIARGEAHMREKWLMGLLALVMLSIGACARQPSTSVPQDAKRDGGVAPDVPGLSLLEEQVDLGSGQGAGPL